MNTTSSAPQNNPDKTTFLKKVKIPTAFTAALTILGLTASIVLAILPGAFKSISGSERPDSIIFFVAGIIGIVFTALLFGVLAKLKMGLTRTAIVLALGYNTLLVLIKLTLAPMSLYIANSKSVFQTTMLQTNPNEVGFYLLAGVIILLVYVGVFQSVYRYHSEDKNRKVKQVSTTSKTPTSSLSRAAVTLLIGIVLLALLGTGLWVLPLIVIGPTLGYVNYIFSATGVAIGVAILVAVVMANMAFAEVEKQAVKVGNAALLASFFWVGISLIVAYHIMWLVFMVALVTTWPFKTYTPK